MMLTEEAVTKVLSEVLDKGPLTQEGKRFQDHLAQMYYENWCRHHGFSEFTWDELMPENRRAFLETVVTMLVTLGNEGYVLKKVDTEAE